MTDSLSSTQCDSPGRTPFTSKMRLMRERYERIASEERKMQQTFWRRCVTAVRSQDLIKAHARWFPNSGAAAAIVAPVGIPEQREQEYLLQLAVALLV